MKLKPLNKQNTHTKAHTHPHPHTHTPTQKQCCSNLSAFYDNLLNTHSMCVNWVPPSAMKIPITIPKFAKKLLRRQAYTACFKIVVHV